MTTEIIKRIVDDECAEQLTALLCHHWAVATERLECLAQEVTDDMDTCIEAEIYAALMRMQRAVMALMELNKIPTALLFSEYLERINKTVSNTSIRQSVMTLLQRLLDRTSSNKQAAPFFDLVIQTMTQHVTLPEEQQETIRQMVSPQYIFGVCAQHLNPEDLMMMAQIIQNINTEGDAKEQEEVTSQLQNMRQAMEALDSQMSENLQMMLIGLLLLTLLPGMMISLMQQSRANSKAMAKLFHTGTRKQPLVEVLARALRDTPRGQRQQFVEGDYDSRTHQRTHRTGEGARRVVCQVDHRPQGF